MVDVFREVRRVLRKDGTLWLNLGDSYAASGERSNNNGTGATTMGTLNKAAGLRLPRVSHGLKPKDLVGIPWRVAFALQADGWYLRSDIIWSKPNPMPESVTDRPTKAHEYVFLLTKSARYYYDADAVREPHESLDHHLRYPNSRYAETGKWGDNGKSGGVEGGMNPAGRNLRSVWTIATAPYPGAHFATFPPKLVEPCVKAGTSERGVCGECGAPWVREVELTPEYAALLDSGWNCRFQVEWDPFCQRVLAKHWPDVPRFGDITTVDWSGVERVDLLAGGFPCQPFSVAGRKKGLADDRWLWPEFAAAIRVLQPHFVLVENVPGLLAGHGGMGNVLGDLADLGYDAEWCVISAADVGAPHLRRRVWIVAYPDSTRSQGLQWRGALGPEGAPSVGSPSDSGASSARNVADTTSGRRQGSGEPFASVHPTTRALGQAIDALDGRFAGEWSVEPDVGRVAHGVPARVDRLRALGNAVVPQVVQVIGEALIRGFD
jgi:site-specific DNA-cytosine methylase